MKSNIILNEVITNEMTEIEVVEISIVKVSIEEVSAEDEVVNSSEVQVKICDCENDAINDVKKTEPLEKTIFESSS